MIDKKYPIVVAVLAASALVLWSASAAWTQEAVTLTIEEMDAETAFPRIEATVTVVNPSGVPVADLGQSDFEVLEDGQPVTIKQISSQPNPVQPIAVCVVLDLSGSAPLEDVKAAARRFLDTLGPKDRVCLIGFNTPLDFNVQDPTKEVKFTTDKESVRAVINDLVSAGDSAVYEAIYKGVLWTAQETAERRAVVVMTDGYDTISRPEIATADTPRTAAADKRIPIFTIGVYNPEFASRPDYLRVLADETGGEYYQADPNNPREMASRFEEVGKRLRLQYQLAFSSKLEPLEEEDHVLTIRAITPAGEGEIQRTVTYRAPAVPIVVELQRDVNGELQVLKEGQELRGRILLVPRIAARNPIAQVEYYVDGVEQPVHTALTEAVEQYTHERWEWEWNTRRVAEGEHKVEVVAYDDAGTASDRFPLTIQVAYPPYTVFGMNLWLVVAIVAAVVFLVLFVFFLLRRRAPSPVPVGPSAPAGPPPAPAAPEEPPTRTAVPPAAPSAPAAAEGERAPTAVVGPEAREPAVPAPAKTERLRREPKAMGWLVVEEGPHTGREFRLQEVTSIGRSGDNDVIIDDPAVSRQHAKVRLEGQSFVIFDLGATNPTEVNGQEIGKHQLVDGDRVRIGKSVLVFKQLQQSQG